MNDLININVRSPMSCRNSIAGHTCCGGCLLMTISVTGIAGAAGLSGNLSWQIYKSNLKEYTKHMMNLTELRSSRKPFVCHKQVAKCKFAWESLQSKCS